MGMRWLASGLLVAVACTGGDTGDADEALTLENCTTSIGDGVPAFFETYCRCATIEVDGDDLVIESNGLPPHPSPYYPDDDPNWVAMDTSEGHFENPNEIAPQSYRLELPLTPTAKGLVITRAMVDEQAATSDDEYRCPVQGIALDGVALFSGTAAPGDSLAEEHDTFDQYEGHPQNTGQYHHHGANPAALAVIADAGLTTSTTPGEADVELFGVMCDGTLVLGCTELDGTAATSTGLDAQNGHVHDLADAHATVHFDERYHVHACDGLGRHYTPEIAFYE